LEYARGTIGQSYCHVARAIFVFVELLFTAQTGLGQNPRDDFFGSEIVNVDDEPGDRGVEPVSRAIKVVE